MVKKFILSFRFASYRTLVILCLFQFVVILYFTTRLITYKPVVASHPCRINISQLETRVSVVMYNIMSNDLKAELFKDLTPGGSWFPKTCDALSHVAVIIPFRDRQTHLEILLQNLHPFLQHQKIHYTIFVIEQVPPATFNRALLMNVGFVESQHTYNFSCYIFHDVDLIPENNQLLYTCPQGLGVAHMASGQDKWKWKTPYRGYIGGVVAVSRETFTSVNGFSNVYFGWGGEDDDFRKRLTDKGIKIQYMPPEIGRYKAIAHGKDKTNPKNIMREFFLYHTKWLQPVDGLTSLRYTKVSLEKRPTYTLIRVNVSEEDVIENIWRESNLKKPTEKEMLALRRGRRIGLHIKRWRSMRKTRRQKHSRWRQRRIGKIHVDLHVAGFSSELEESTKL